MRSSSSIDFDREMTLFEEVDDEDADSLVGDGTIGLFVMDMEQMDDDDDDDMGESDEPIVEDDSTTTNRDVSKSKGIAKGMSQQQVPVGAKRKKSSDLPPVTKWAIIARHMDELNRASDRLFHGALEEISVAFNVSRRTVQRIVCDYKLQIEQGLLHTLHRVPDLTSKKSCRNLPLDETMIANINTIRARSQNRLTVKALALAYEDAFGQKISHATLCRYNKRSAETVPTIESSAQISQQATSFDRQQPLINRNMVLLDPSDMMGYHPNLSNPSVYMPISSSSSSTTVQQHGVPNQTIYNAVSNHSASFPVHHQSFHNTHNASHHQNNHH